MPNLFDIHSHLNFPDFDDDRKDVIKRSLDAGIWMLNVGSAPENSKQAVEIAEQYESGVYASVGIHPTDVGVGNLVSDIKGLAKDPKVVAIGECGLDYFRIKNNELIINQKEIFKQHIDLALEINKPLIIHCREMHNEVIDILNSYQDSKLRGDIHFFSGTWEHAQKYLNLGFSVSFTGVITFTKDYDETIKKAPLDKIMIETDAPFVAPVPFRGQRNEPLYVQEVAKRIAKIRGESYEKISEATTQNALKLFGIFDNI